MGSSLPSVENGAYTASGHNFGNIASLVCGKGFSASSNANTDLECQGNGRWSTATATCEQGKFYISRDARKPDFAFAKTKAQISCETVRFVSDLVGKPKDRFSRAATHMI